MTPKPAQSLAEDLARRIAEDAVISAVLAKADSGTADFTDTSRYHDRMAQIVGAVMRDHVLSIPQDERSVICEAILRDRYRDSAQLLSRVQEALDAALGIRLAPQIPAFQTERAKQIGNSLADQTVSDETIRRRAENASANVVRTFQDRYVQKNVKFRSDAGLKCWIIRDAGAKCCDWCAGLDGRYAYGSEPKEVYGRHDNCTCTVTYENGRKRQDVWSRRTWEAPEPGAGAGERVVLTEEQARELEAKNGLTKPAGSGMIRNIRLDDIKAAVTGSPITPEVAEYIFSILSEQNDQFKFDRVVVMHLGDKIIMQTDPRQNGTFYDIVLNLNSDFLGGKTVEQIDAEIATSKASVIQSLREAVIHEIYHARTYFGKNKGQIDALYEQLEGLQVTGISTTAMKDGFECIAESGVLFERGKFDSIPEIAKNLLRIYLGVKI